MTPNSILSFSPKLLIFLSPPRHHQQIPQAPRVFMAHLVICSSLSAVPLICQPFSIYAKISRKFEFLAKQSKCFLRRSE